jgi:hypothetical protein
MPMMFVAALMLTQAPTTVQPSEPAVKQKPKQHCEYVEVTGSRRPQKVCRDADGVLDLGPDVANSAPNSGMFHAPPPAPAPAGIGGRPQ